MKKLGYLLVFMFSVNVFAQEALEISKDENVTKEVNKIMTELEKTPVVVEKKRVEKKVEKSAELIKEELESELVIVENTMIDLKTVIAQSIVNKTEEKQVLEELKVIKVGDFSDKFMKDIENLEDDKEKSELAKIVKELQNKVVSFNSLKDSIVQRYENKAHLKETVISNTPIERSLNTLNTKFGEYNKGLSTIGLDIGRVIMFVVSMIGFILMAFVLNYILTLFLTKYTAQNKGDFLEDNNFDSIKAPILFLATLIGFQVGIEIILYPSTIPEYLTLTFVVINTVNILVIFNKFVDIVLYILTHKKFIKAKRPEILNLITRVIKILALIFVIAFLLTRFGVDTDKIFASLGLGTLAIALAAKGKIEKFMDGVKLIIEDTFSIGDWIYLPSIKMQGTVVDVGLFNTKIRTFDNGVLVVPNSEIANAPYLNWSRRKVGRQIQMKLGVKYSSKKEDIRNVIKDLREMLEEHPEISSPSDVDFTKKKMKDGKLVSIGDEFGLKNTLMVHLSEFGQSSIDIDVYAFSKTVVWDEWRGIKEDIMFKVMDILEKNNVSLAFPSKSIYIEEKNAISMG